MEPLMFLGERRSVLAKKHGWCWEDGHLAAKQLFDALRACGINPEQCIFVNWFERKGRMVALRYANSGGTLIAMGRIVEKELNKLNMPHVYLTHPAARGSIRMKKRYTAHVKAVLTGLKTTEGRRFDACSVT